MSNDPVESEALISVLSLLSDGEFHSGEELGALLGVSRAAVWKTLKKLEPLGVQVLSVKGRGYCIVGGLDLLDSVAIQKQYHNRLDIKVFTQLDSTNSYLLRQNNADRQVCLAEAQTAGRGRRGRGWVSPFAQNLYLSIGWRFDGGLASVEGLSLAVGVIVLQALEIYGFKNLALKWPNDILCRDKKLGGILIEVSGDPLGDCLCVIGIGLNISMCHASCDLIEQPWTSLREISAEQGVPLISRNQIVFSLLDNLLSALSTYQRDGFRAYRASWIMAAAYINEQINIHAADGVQTGLLRGVDNSGALLVDVNGCEKIFHGGEVSVRCSNVS